MRTVGMVFLVAVVVLAAALESAPAQATGQQWQWMQRTFSGGVATNPSGRYLHAMAYDTVRNMTVFFGGYYYRKNSWPNPATIIYYNDTWERDVAAWLPCSPKTKPSVRYDPSLAYDAARGVTLFSSEGGTEAARWLTHGSGTGSTGRTSRLRRRA